MTPVEFIRFFGVVPMSIEKPCTHPSNSELRRWVDQKAVVINGKHVKSDDEVEFPVNSMVFFPNGKRKTTVI